jgi:hypothetical protein
MRGVSCLPGLCGLSWCSSGCVVWNDTAAAVLRAHGVRMVVIADTTRGTSELRFAVGGLFG